MNKIYTHPGQPQMQVEVILASQLNQEDWFGDGKPPIIYTIRLRYPRIIHSEIMTHRDFSRNARSSRAVPVKTMLLETTSIPFIPWHWGKNQKGMQASEECNEMVWVQEIQMPLAGSGYGHPLDWKGAENELTGATREDAWLMARDRAIQSAEAFMEAGYHKQIPNRLLEPFSWIDTLITATNWKNFIHLRDHKDAEPHLQDLARLVSQAIKEADVQQLDFGEWHLPYITAKDWEHARCFFPMPMSKINEPLHDWLRVLSSARCARISYAPFDGDASYAAELARYESLVNSDRVHASPLEHQATPDVKSPVRTIRNTRSGMTLEMQSNEWEAPHYHGNLTGWKQNRKYVTGEYVPG